MAKVKFNVKAIDRDTKEVFPVSDKFVKVTDAFAERIKALQDSDKNHKKSFEFEGASKSKAKAEPKGKAAADDFEDDLTK